MGVGCKKKIIIDYTYVIYTKKGYLIFIPKDRPKGRVGSKGVNFIYIIPSNIILKEDI